MNKLKPRNFVWRKRKKCTDGCADTFNIFFFSCQTELRVFMQNFQLLVTTGSNFTASGNCNFNYNYYAYNFEPINIVSQLNWGKTRSRISTSKSRWRNTLNNKAQKEIQLNILFCFITYQYVHHKYHRNIINTISQHLDFSVIKTFHSSQCRVIYMTVIAVGIKSFSLLTAKSVSSSDVNRGCGRSGVFGSSNS